MNILGIGNMQNSSAALIVAGKIVAAVEEERFNRIKHYQGFPYESISYCLKAGNISFDDIDLVVIGWNPFQGIFHRLKETLKISLTSGGLGKKLQRGNSYFSVISEQFSAKSLLKKHFSITRKLRVKYINHHLAHAACASVLSSYKENVYLVVDGVGEYQTISWGFRSNRKWEKLGEIKYPYSIGHLYSIFTSFLGFKPNNGEGKVMGMAAYGNPIYYDKLMELIIYNPFQKKLQYDQSIFDYSLSLFGEFNNRFLEIFGEKREPESVITQNHYDIAASVQRFTEDFLIDFADYLFEKTNSPNLCLSGGVALNCLANAKIKERTNFQNIFVPSAPSDAGVSLGAALYYASQAGELKEVPLNPLWGPSFSDEQIMESLQHENITDFEYVSNVTKKCAEVLAENKIVGWFQGHMEFGPRALGARSIFTLPKPAENKEILNSKVKLREPFRPFAPMVKDDFVKIAFTTESIKSPFMSFASEVKKGYIDVMPAVTHVNQRSRLQTVDNKNFPLIYTLLEEVEILTGVPVILNTSFNVRGEPIVCTPTDAIRCFKKTGMDCLFLGNYFLCKSVTTGKTDDNYRFGN